ncbi:hypothetical protein [Lysinibacillus parviboronicapiens]|uniref:hypothetical protein n=1 Tax=Lysinibacillus parviboronicapiens TaxID=436516 RepID=UPI000D3B36AA|nr:hypothetical protein [Lysinibacillus parviboronicapiens]
MQNIHVQHQKASTGSINQTANPLQKGDIVDVLNKYYDPTTIGDWVYSVRVLKSSNPEIMEYELNGIRLVACYKVDILPSH